MSPAPACALLVAAVAVVAAGVVAGVVLATRQDPAQPKAQCRQRPAGPDRAGGRRRRTSAAVRAALALAADGGGPRARAGRAARHPKDPVVQFNYGIALFCAGYVAEAEQAFRAGQEGRPRHDLRDARRRDPASAVLPPQDGLYPSSSRSRADPLLVQGVLLQRQGHQHSAERLYARAARLQPDDDEAQVAAAVGRFDEDNLSASFSRLGPLVKRFPRSQSVRYHLGLLLAWTGQRDQAVKEFRLARALGPRTPLGKASRCLPERSCDRWD